MEMTEDTQVKDIIKESLKQSISYVQYRSEVERLVAENSTSGNEKTKDLVEYTLLNDRRMKRWDKTIKVSEDVKKRIFRFNGDVIWLVITESWCGDAAHVNPAINKVAELSENINLRFVFRDENEALMNQFLTNGGKSVPKLIMIDNESGNVLETFGPRPSGATQLVLDYKKKHAALTPEFKEELQHWYNKDKGQNVISDLLKLLKV